MMNLCQECMNYKIKVVQHLFCNNKNSCFRQFT